jgi:hypothetical protein
MSRLLQNRTNRIDLQSMTHGPEMLAAGRLRGGNAAPVTSATFLSGLFKLVSMIIDPR